METETTKLFSSKEIVPSAFPFPPAANVTNTRSDIPLTTIVDSPSIIDSPLPGQAGLFPN